MLMHTGSSFGTTLVHCKSTEVEFLDVIQILIPNLFISFSGVYKSSPFVYQDKSLMNMFLNALKLFFLSTEIMATKNISISLHYSV
jgi:hypothetical protein